MVSTSSDADVESIATSAAKGDDRHSVSEVMKSHRDVDAAASMSQKKLNMLFDARQDIFVKWLVTLFTSTDVQQTALYYRCGEFVVWWF